MDVERHLLSKMVDDHTYVNVAEAGVTAQYFTDPNSRRVFQTLVDHTSKYGEVPSREALKLDFPNYKFLTSQESLEFLIDRIRWNRRRGLQEAALADAMDAFEAEDLDAVEAVTTGLAGVIAREIVSTHDIDRSTNQDERRAHYRALRDRPDGLIGIPSGLTAIDRATQGFQPGQLITFVGPPKAGKSTVLALAARAAHASGVTPMFIGFEMPNSETNMRLDSFAAQVSHNRFRSGTLDKDEENRLEKFWRQSEADHPFILVEDTHNSTTLSGIQAKIEKHKPDFVLVDGVYMMQDEQGEPQGSSQALTNITRGFKRLSMAMGIPIAISTQVLEWKMDKKQGITSGSIGYSSSFSQDSDAVLGVERTEDPNINKVKVVIARNCPPMETYVQWDWDKGLFVELPGNPFEDIDASSGHDDF